jgi:hypothetical protein
LFPLSHFRATSCFAVTCLPYDDRDDSAPHPPMRQPRRSREHEEVRDQTQN